MEKASGKLMREATGILRHHPWCIIIMAGIVFVLGSAIFLVADDRSLDALGVTSAVISIVLSAIVIVYMLLQGYRMDVLVKESTEATSKKMEKIYDAVQLVSQPTGAMKQATEGGALSDGYNFDVVGMPRLFILTLYCLVKAYKSGKAFKLVRVAGEIQQKDGYYKGVSTVDIAMAMMGSIYGVQAFFPPGGIVADGLSRNIKILPPGFEDQVMKALDIVPDAKAGLRIIDGYFEQAQSA